MKLRRKIAIVLLATLGHATAMPPVIDDQALTKKMADGIGTFADQKQATKGSDLVKSLAKAPSAAELSLPAGLPPATTYEEQCQSVFQIASVFKCGKCEHWHPRGSATAWCLTADGVMVTNYHVFEKASGDSWGVCGIDGKTYRVIEVIAKNKDADAALFRVDAKGLTPLALGDDAPVGSDLSIISHPNGRLFLQSFGKVARYAKATGRKSKGNSIWMDVTAEYARGSSGGPALNPDGRVVGMVSNTQSINYGPPGKDGQPTGPHQMVIRNCVPVAAIRALTKEPAKTASVP